MKTIKLMIAVAAIAACASAVRAGGMDFDGASGKQALLSEKTAQVQVPEVPSRKGPEAEAGPVLTISIEKNATSKETFTAEGAQARLRSVKYILNVKSPGSDSQWAVGNNDKIYSLGAARPAPEFTAVRKLADALALTGDSAASRGSKCETATTFTCVNGQTNSCKVDRCGWCGNWGDGDWHCEWSTESAPYACSPNGYRC